MKNKIKIIIFLAIIILSAGFFLRYYVVTNTFVRSPVYVISPIIADTQEYYYYAQNLKDFGIYSKQAREPQFVPDDLVPDAHRNPGYSLFLLPFTEFPPSLEMVKEIQIAQAIISTITLVLALLFFRSFLSWPYALGGTFLVALSPHLISMNTFVISECLFIFFLILAGLTVSNFGKHKTFMSAVIMGVVLGLALLVRPTVLYFPVFMLILLSGMNIKKIVSVIIAFTLGFYLVYGPWVVRNQISVPVSTESSLKVMTIQKGMYPGLMYQNDPKTFGYPNHYDPEWENRKTLGVVLEEIKRRFIEKPIEYLRWYLVGKPITFLSWGIIVGTGDVFVYPITKSPFLDNIIFFSAHEFMYWLHWPLILLSLFASIIIWFPGWSKKVSVSALIPIRFCSLMLVYFILVHIAGTPLPRYSIPIFPYIYAMAMVGLSVIFSKALAFYKERKLAKVNVRDL